MSQAFELLKHLLESVLSVVLLRHGKVDIEGCGCRTVAKHARLQQVFGPPEADRGGDWLAE